MANTTLQRVPGIALVVSSATTIAGTFTSIDAFTDCSVEVSIDDANASAANATWVQWVMTQKQGSGSISGFMGAQFPQSLNVGDEFYLKIVAGTSDVSMALKQAQQCPGKCRITKMSDKVMKDPGTVQFDFKWGYID